MSLLDAVYAVALEVREKYYDDIIAFMNGETPLHDCTVINGEVAERLKRKLGLDAKLVNIRGMIDEFDYDHIVVSVVIDNVEYIVDAVPELSGAFDYILGGPLVSMWPDYERYYYENSFLYKS